jgi:hypothetical protein
MSMTTLQLITPDDLISGGSFIKSIAGYDHKKREDATAEALLAGNVPTYMREFVDVSLTFADSTGVGRKLTFRVLPDYLTVGTDSDKIRMPLWPLTAQRIADAWNCVLPTTKLVTIIWNAANKLSPQPWGPPYDETMQDTNRFVIHDKRIDDSIKKSGFDERQLLAGHKKDVVLTKMLVNKPKSVAIFGWHQLNGKNIQPLYLGHSATYTDYSHGIRLVSRDCLLDDQPDDLTRIMQDKTVSMSVSSEGPLPIVRQPGV